MALLHAQLPTLACMCMCMCMCICMCICMRCLSESDAALKCTLYMIYTTETHHPCAGPSQPRNEQASPAQQVSPPPQPSSPLVQFTSYLKAVYGGQKFPNFEKWPPCSSKKYINLACIDKRGVSKGKFEKFTEASIHGNIDDIISEKHPMKFHQIAKMDDDSLPKIILVEGAPGVGKSTFAWKLCREWSKGKILRQYKLVVLLRLRDKHVREAETLYDLIYYHDSNKRTLIVEQIYKLNGKEILLLCEGYDELPAQMQNDKESILFQIISGGHLPKATVLVTSRQSASGLLRNYYWRRISQHIEILGFTKENIQTYINENVKDCEERQGLERYLSCYPHIRTMMYVPLNSVIVVEVYHQCHDKDEPAPKTMTELYTSLVHTLLIRHLKDTVGKIKVMVENLESLKAYGVYEQFCKVCKTAFDGIDNDQQVIFYMSDGFETLGLMQEVHELYVDRGDCVSYNFLHLTIQEYLAAVHLSMQPVDVQIQHFKCCKRKNNFNMVLRFLSGLTKFKNYPKHELSLIIEPQQEGGPYSSYSYNSRESRDLNFHWLFEAQDVHYISSLLRKEKITVHRISTPFEAYALGYCVAHSNLKWKADLNFSSDSNNKEMFIRGLQAEETQFKGSIVTTKSSSYFTNEDIADESRLGVANYFSWHPTNENIEILVNDDTEKFIKPIALKFLRGVTLKITSISFLSGVTTELVKDLTSSIDSLQVAMNENEMKVEQLQILCDLIVTSTSLKQFAIDIQTPIKSPSKQEVSNMCSCLEQIVVALGLNTSLVDASLNIGQYILTVIAVMLRSGRSELYTRVLRLVKVIRFDDKYGELSLGEDNKYSSIEYNTNAASLSPTTIYSMKCHGNLFRCAGVNVRNDLFSVLCSLREFVISGDDLSRSHMKCVTDYLIGTTNEAKSDYFLSTRVKGENKEHLSKMNGESEKVHNIEDIGLTHCKIEAIGAKFLAKALCVNTSIKTLNLNYSCLGDEGAKALADMLGRNVAESSGTVNTTLEHVDLHNCNIGPVGAQHLAHALCVNTSVKTLDLGFNVLSDKEDLEKNQAACPRINLDLVNLRNCQIGPVETHYLTQVLSVNTSLHLNDNPLGDEGAKVLAEMLGGKGAESSGTVNTTLEHVGLSSCHIGPIGAQHLAQALCVNTSVKTLDLHGNAIGDQGVEALAKVLRAKHCRTVNTTLECKNVEIELYNCSIGPVGTQLLAQGLCSNTTVKKISFGDNPIGDEGAMAFASMLGGSISRVVGFENAQTALQDVNLSLCSIGSVGAQHLAQALCVNTSVKTLDLSHNLLGDEGAKALAEMLMLGGNGAESSGTVNTTLEHVDLGWCNIGNIGAVHLAQALCVNTSVKTLCLFGNKDIGSEGASAVKKMLEKRNLTHVNEDIFKSHLVNNVVYFKIRLESNST